MSLSEQSSLDDTSTDLQGKLLTSILEFYPKSSLFKLLTNGFKLVATKFRKRGADGRTYPWGGEKPSSKLLNWAKHPTYGRKATCPVGSFHLAASPFGCLDMAGNGWEWTGDWWAPYASGARTNPTGPRDGKGRVLRGGCWQSDSGHCRTTTRFSLAPDERRNFVGFRVARSG